MGTAVLVDPCLDEFETERQPASGFSGRCGLGHLTPSYGVGDKSRPVVSPAGRGAPPGSLGWFCDCVWRVKPRLRGSSVLLRRWVCQDHGKLAPLRLDLATGALCVDLT